MSKKARNTFIGGMNQDAAKSKYQPTKYYTGRNIKVVTEDGLSTGNIENEDGNVLAFQIPDLQPVKKIQFVDPQNPTADTLTIIYKHPTTGLNTSVLVQGGDIETLYNNLVAELADLITAEYIKLINSGSYITLVTYPTYSEVFVSLSSSTYIEVITVVDSLTNLKIIGWTTLRDDIVVFTTSSESTAPVGTDGQIWKFSYNLSTKKIDGTTTEYLNPFLHLKYNNILNFSTYYCIGTEAIGHYENSKKGRVYWTDEYNNTRSANLLDPDLLGIDPSLLSVASRFIASKPIVTNISGGGSLLAGSVVQYCYRLARTGGNFTAVSPLSNPLPLGVGIPTTGTYNTWNYWGGNSGGFVGHVVTYEVSNIDTNYDLIEHIAVITNGTGTSIYKFAEESVPQDGTLIVSHTGNESLNIPFTPEEFSAIRRTFKRCKTLTVKDKRLLVGNLNLDDSVIESFDTRAYRFDAGRVAKLTDHERVDILIDGVTKEYTTNSNLTWKDIPEDFDAINPFNKDENLTAHTGVNNYKYQSDGIQLGGEGPNVKYKFTTFETESKTTLTGYDATGAYKAFEVGKITQADRDNTLLNGEKVLIPNDFKNFKGASICANFTGYARGEVYRFGITFYDLSGNPYETKWIGDIKFPDTNDYQKRTDPYTLQPPFILHKTTPSYLSEPSTPATLISIGIEFDIDISAIKSNISGFEIVRVERPLNERTRLGTGVGVPFTSYPLPPARKYNVVPGSSYIDDWYEAYITPGQPEEYFSALPDIPYINVTAPSYSLVKSYGFLSPITYFNTTGNYFNVATGSDSVVCVGYISHRYEGGQSYFAANAAAASLPNNEDKSVMANIVGALFWRNDNTNTANPPTREKRNIVKGQILFPGQLITDSGYTTPGPHRHIWNSSFATRDAASNYEYMPAGFSTQKAIIEIDSAFTYYNASGLTVPTSTQAQWRILSYNRTLTNQYGGDTYEARSRNTYISTGGYKIVKPETSTVITGFKVFGGDVFTQYFPSSYFFYRNNGTTGNMRYQLGFGYPCESPVNIDFQLYATSSLYGAEAMRADWANTNGAGLIGTSLINIPDNYYNAFYSKNNNSKLIYFPKGFLEDYSTEFPHRIWASEKKLDGELFDSWRVFLPNTYSEVEGMYGQINKLITERDQVIFYQDEAMGIVAVNDRTSVPSQDGTSIVLGKGGILDHYQYLSRKTGTKHKFSVIAGASGIYHFDSNIFKVFRYGQGLEPLSDTKELHSDFNKFNGSILNTDKILLGKGIHGTYDRVRNKVYMTFLDASKDYREEFLPYNILTRAGISTSDPTARYVTFIAPGIGKHRVAPGNTVKIEGEAQIPLWPNLLNVHQFGGNEYTVVEAPETGTYFNIDVHGEDALTIDIGFDGTFLASSDPTTINCKVINPHLNYTISYNENLQAFESTHDFTPRLYLENSGNLFTLDPSKKKAWRHYEGVKNTYYGYTYPSELELIINPDADITKVFDNIEYKGEMYVNNVDQSNLTLQEMQFLNDHQDSGKIPLTVGQNVVRRLRSWRSNVFRDAKSPRGDARMRDYYIKLILKHTPTMTSYNITRVDTNDNSPYISVYSPNIGADRNLIGSYANITGTVILSYQNGLNPYTFSGRYLIHDITDDGYIVIDLGFNNINSNAYVVPTNMVVQILTNERMVLHDIITTYRYSNN